MVIWQSGYHRRLLHNFSLRCDDFGILAYHWHERLHLYAFDFGWYNHTKYTFLFGIYMVCCDAAYRLHCKCMPSMIPPYVLWCCSSYSIQGFSLRRHITYILALRVLCLFLLFHIRSVYVWQQWWCCYCIRYCCCWWWCICEWRLLYYSALLWMANGKSERMRS